MGRLVVAEPGGGNPRRLGSFVGRRDELHRFRQLVSAGTPLVTVSGLSGVGKTRFVREALGELVDSWFSAAEVDDVSGLIPQLEQRAGELMASSRPDRNLIVIDSMDDAAVGRAAIAALDRFENLQIVVTSQSRMNVSGEVLFRLPPLSYPTTTEPIELTDATKWDALECFTMSAQRIQPNFTLTSDNINAVVELVREAGGLPLAIDLLVNWLRVLSVEQLVERITRSPEPFSGGAADLPSRQQDLRRSIRASFEALAPDEQEVLSALAHLGNVSTTGLSAGVGTAVPLDVLGRLIDRNLIAIDGSTTSRLSLHPTVRRVVAELSNGCDFEERFLAWLGTEVATNAPLLDSVYSKQAFGAMDALVDDIPAALELFDRHQLAVSKLVADLSRFWYLTRQSRISMHWSMRAVDSFTGHHDLRVRLLLSASVAARFLADATAAALHANEALTTARQAENETLIATIIPEMISANTFAGNFTDLSELVLEAVAICEANEMHGELAELLISESERLLACGQLQDAIACAQRAIDAAQRSASLAIRHDSSMMLSHAYVALDQFDRALEVLAECESIADPLDRRCGKPAAWSLYRGVCLDEIGRSAEAVQPLRDAAAEFEELEQPLNLSQSTRLLAEALSAAGQHAEARRQFARSIELGRVSLPPFRLLVGLVAVAISRPGTRPDLALCEQILRSMDESFPGFLETESGLWRRNLAALRLEISDHLETSALDSPLPTIDELIAQTLAQLVGPPAQPRSFGLSTRESEVLRRVALGETDKEIADGLLIGIRTVNSHVSSVLRKLGVDRRRHAAAWARANLVLTD